MCSKILTSSCQLTKVPLFLVPALCKVFSWFLDRNLHCAELPCLIMQIMFKMSRCVTSIVSIACPVISLNRTKKLHPDIKTVRWTKRCEVPTCPEHLKGSCNTQTFAGKNIWRSITNSYPKMQ